MISVSARCQVATASFAGRGGGIKTGADEKMRK